MLAVGLLVASAGMYFWSGRREHDPALVGVWKPVPDDFRHARILFLSGGAGAEFGWEFESRRIEWWTEKGVLWTSSTGDEDGGATFLKHRYTVDEEYGTLRLDTDSLLRGVKEFRRIKLP